MNEGRPKWTESGWMFIVWWLAWAAAVAIPVSAVAVTLPVTLPYAVLAGLALSLAFPPFACGLEWDDPRLTKEHAVVLDPIGDSAWW